MSLSGVPLPAAKSPFESVFRVKKNALMVDTVFFIFPLVESHTLKTESKPELTISPFGNDSIRINGLPSTILMY